MNSKKSFFNLVFQYAFPFAIIYGIIEMGIMFFKNINGNTSFSQVLENFNWLHWLFKVLIVAVFYGLFMAGYYKFFKKR
ncbi:MAG: hypothetical protein ACWA42_07225 [Lutibacter sp.]